MGKVTQTDRDLAERLCYGMSEKAIGEAAMLITRHRTNNHAELVEALRRIATVDMGGGFLGAQACREVARKALSLYGGERSD